MMIIKKVEGHEHYIAEDGTILKPMKHWKTNSGYDHIKLEGKHYDVHRLVAKHFVEGYEEGMVVNHKDGNKDNNHKDNLEWVTQHQNIQHYLQNGGSAIKNFKNCYLYKGEELLAECKSVMEASKLAESYGCSFSMINKHRKHKDYRIVKKVMV